MDQEQLNGWIPSISRAEELLEWTISNSTPDPITRPSQWDLSRGAAVVEWVISDPITRPSQCWI